MSHFYGVLRGQAGETTRCGSKVSGVRTVAASWHGAIAVHVWFDEKTGEDRYRVDRIPWCGNGKAYGPDEALAEGSFNPED